MPNARNSWPYDGSASSRSALTLTPDGLWNSDRPLVGPLRRGTAGPVGPSGFGGRDAASDMGVDRISPRPRDAMGQKYPETAIGESKRISR